jgi:transposase
MRPDTARMGVVRRAQAALLMADDVATADIAVLVGVHPRTVARWRARFRAADPVDKIADASRSGRPRALSRNPNAQGSLPKRVDRLKT